MIENINKKLEEIKTKLVEINNILKDPRLQSIYKDLETLSTAIYSIITRDKKTFILRMDYTEKNINVYVNDMYITSIEIDNMTINEIYEKIFSNDKVKQYLIDKAYEKIAELTDVLSWNANVIEQLKYLEQEIAAIETRLDP